jgi:hypothetical protein
MGIGLFFTRFDGSIGGTIELLREVANIVTSAEACRKNSAGMYSESFLLLVNIENLIDL